MKYVLFTNQYSDFNNMKAVKSKQIIASNINCTLLNKIEFTIALEVDEKC